MRWSERQRAMLLEMGVRVWTLEPALADGPTSTAPPASREAVDDGRRSATETVPQPVTDGDIAGTPRPVATPAGEPVGPADWLVLGEPGMPGDGAAAASRQLQDRLLDNMLRAVRVSREAPSRSGRACVVMPPGATSIAAGGDAGTELGRLLDAVRPRVILALGRAAAVALLPGDEPLGKLRGRVHAFHGVPVVASFALAYLLRHPADKARAWDDLCLAVRTVEAAAAGPPPPESAVSA